MSICKKRVEEIKSDKEYNDAFYPGQYYEIHSLLYSKLGKKINRGNESFDGTQYFVYHGL